MNTTEARHCPECQQTGRNANPEMTVTLTYEQVRYLQETALRHYMSACLAWPDGGAEEAQNRSVRIALTKALNTLDYDHEGNVWQVSGR